MEQIVVNESGLVGKDLSRPFTHFKASSPQGLPVPLAKFRKKEPLETMAKSILKHRIQTLTGQAMADIEQELGFSIKAGKTITVSQLRSLAHFLILECNGLLNDTVVQPSSTPSTPTAGSLSRKRPAAELDQDQLEQNGRKRSRSSRKSIATPMVPQSNTPRGTRRSLASTPMRQALLSPIPAPVQEDNEEMDDNLGSDPGNIPTPAMVQQQKRKINASPKVSPRKTTKVVMNPEPKSEIGIPGSPALAPKAGRRQNYVYLMSGNPFHLSSNRIMKDIPDFPGFNMMMIHTPADWDASHALKMARTLQKLNKDAGLETFTILLGCDLSNVHLFKDALSVLTKHVQFVVFDVEKRNLKTIGNGKLRETVSFFLLGYVFPGSSKEGSALPGPMVHQEGTTCIKAGDVEELENRIVMTFTEENGWILDLCCKGRELSLAAQKMGRFALAFDEEVKPLQELENKALAIGKFHDPSLASSGSRILEL